MTLLKSLMLLSSLTILTHALPNPATSSDDCNDQAQSLPANSTVGAEVANTTSTIVFDGRIKSSAVLTDFDADTSPFNPGNVKGDGLKFSDLIVFPNVSQSLFDQAVDAKPFEVTLNDKSIFVPGGGKPQSAIRRAELIPAGAGVANNATTTGTKTLHFSVRSDAQRPLNTSHEYQLAFLETADFSANQFILKTGTLIGSSSTESNNLVLTGSTKESSPVLFSTPFTADTFHNFALVLNFDQNNVQVLYSTDQQALASQTKTVNNDLSGNGEFHFGVFKKSTDPGADPSTTGFQESGINEGIIFGSIFLEDSADGTISLS